MRKSILLMAGGGALLWTAAANAQSSPPQDLPAPTLPPAEANPPNGAAPVQPIAPESVLPTPTPPDPSQMPAPMGMNTPAPADTGMPRQWTPIGAAFLLGGGFEDFTNSNVRGVTSSGGSWNARAIAGTHQYLGAEAAYVGTAHNINTLGLASNSSLVSNGLEGALRVNVPVLRGPSLIEPFGFVGLGWQHYNVTNNNSATSDINDKDDIMTLPVGGGLEFAYKMFMADARFTYRETYYNNLMRTSGGNLNNWGVGGQVGVGF